jgi:hypothetical protein
MICTSTRRCSKLHPTPSGKDAPLVAKRMKMKPLIRGGRSPAGSDRLDTMDVMLGQCRTFGTAAMAIVETIKAQRKPHPFGPTLLLTAQPARLSVPPA